eukprot:gene4298-5861_t
MRAGIDQHDLAGHRAHRRVEQHRHRAGNVVGAGGQRHRRRGGDALIELRKTFLAETLLEPA